jgi:hypothetical protein
MERLAMENEKQRAASLLDLIVFILKHKALIFAVVFLAMASSIAYFMIRGAPSSSPLGQAASLYTSACLVEPDGMTVEKLKAILTSREAGRRFAEALLQMPDGRETLQGMIDGSFDRQSPTIQAAVQDGISRRLSVQIEGSFIRLTLAWSTAQHPARLLGDYLKVASDLIRDHSLPGLEVKKKLLQQELKRETDPFLKAKLAERILLTTEIEEAARKATYFGFTVIDPPSPPLPANALPGRGRPNYPVLALLILLASFLLALFLAFCVESVQKLKQQDPQRYEQIRRNLRIGVK